MKNFNEAGTVHYDADTNLHYTDMRLDFVVFGSAQKFDLKIPLKIREVLKLEHYDHALAAGRSTYIAIYLKLALRGMNDPGCVRHVARVFATRAMLEQLYNDFTREQAIRGNQVWATPELMDDPGPKPEKDFER
jgi:hypothetical protein